MSTAALENLLHYIQGLGLSQSNRQWLAERLVEPVDEVHGDAKEFLNRVCPKDEYDALMATGFLAKPYPPYANQTDEEIVQEIMEGESEGYLSANESEEWLETLMK